MKFILSFSLIFFILASCQQTGEINTKDQIEMKTTNGKVVIYQIITRLFGNTETTNKPYGTIEDNGVGKFNDINEKALTQLKKMGVTHVWYTGIIEHAVLTDYTKYGIPLDDADVVKGRAGSPYAIKDYYDVNPDLADEVPNRLQEFKNLIQRTHDLGLKVLIDFVPNHVARAYNSDAKPEGVKDLGAHDDTSQRFSNTNNFYYLPNQSFVVPSDYLPLGEYDFPTKDGQFDEAPAKATGNDQFTNTPSKDDWFETVKLNYGVDYENGGSEHFDPVPDTWNKMYDILKYWNDMGVDGFRCDMAQMVPVAFWNWVIPKLKEVNPESVFIAEIYQADRYNAYIFDGHFDYLYDKIELYDTLKHIIQGHANTDHLTAVWQQQEGISQYMLRFLENHDEQRIASPFFAGSAEKAIPAMVISTTMHTGPIMVYFGQEVGEPGAGIAGFSGEDGRTTHFDYWGVPEHQKWMNQGKFDGGALSKSQKQLRKFYSDILNFSSKSAAITNGGFYDLHYFNRSNDFTGYSDQVYAYLRHATDENLLVVTNFNNSAEECTIRIPQDALDKMGLTGKIRINSNFGKKTEIAVETNELRDQGIVVKVPGYGFEIYSLK